MVWSCKQKPQERLPKQALLAKVKGWNRLGLQPSKMLEVVADRDVWRLNLELLPRNLHGHERALKEEEEGFVTFIYRNSNLGKQAILWLELALRSWHRNCYKIFLERIGAAILRSDFPLKIYCNDLTTKSTCDNYFPVLVVEVSFVKVKISIEWIQRNQGITLEQCFLTFLVLVTLKIL